MFTPARAIILRYQGRIVATASSHKINVIQNAVCRLFDLDVSQSPLIQLRMIFEDKRGEDLVLVGADLWLVAQSLIKEVWVDVQELPHPSVNAKISEALSIFPTSTAEETIFVFVKYPSGSIHTFGPLSSVWPLYFLAFLVEKAVSIPAHFQLKNHSILGFSVPRQLAKKPVIYLYPPREVEVAVELELKGAWEFETRKGERVRWEVVARPDGTRTENATGLEVAYLYREALIQPRRPIDTPPAPRPASPTPRTSFITFWPPSFQPHTEIALLFLPQSFYSAAAPSTITPKPDEVVRVFMLFKLWDTQRTCDWREVVGVVPEVDPTVERFRLVEWGGWRPL
ncbi:hypothetical protein JAAARDRAFT_59293 [Jaapia argillacea MUCL 33604]|uniref:Uncharacterized protein n=1 Tax=Jaapia argillacea MUCL 33604 TaxID=933084 RepID=A0A067Q1G5_9AGAM|nr:hypothetical protein JAAARDRAFT_59293 [Jaapia argillacea MUCL 33604]